MWGILTVFLRVHEFKSGHLQGTAFSSLFCCDDTRLKDERSLLFRGWTYDRAVRRVVVIAGRSLWWVMSFCDVHVYTMCTFLMSSVLLETVRQGQVCGLEGISAERVEARGRVFTAL